MLKSLRPERARHSVEAGLESSPPMEGQEESDGDVAGGNAEEEFAVDFDQIAISLVHCVHLEGRARWYPETQIVDGLTYCSLSKWDSSLCRMIHGKGMNRHKHKVAQNLSVAWWDEVAELRSFGLVTIYCSGFVNVYDFADADSFIC